MRARPGPCQGLTVVEITDNEAIPLRERPAEATAEGAALAERPAPEDRLDIDAPANGDVCTHARATELAAQATVPAGVPPVIATTLSPLKRSVGPPVVHSKSAAS
jgi:hypothetical protein